MNPGISKSEFSFKRICYAFTCAQKKKLHSLVKRAQTLESETIFTEVLGHNKMYHCQIMKWFNFAFFYHFFQFLLLINVDKGTILSETLILDSNMVQFCFFFCQIIKFLLL